jgi:hypothetical protein
MINLSTERNIYSSKQKINDKIKTIGACAINLIPDNKSLFLNSMSKISKG